MFTDGVCQIDLLRTQKIRYLVSIYRQLKAPTENISNRLKLIEEIIKILQTETLSSQTNQVCFFIGYSLKQSI